MQSEGGAAGAVRGALQTGALATTFTASEAPLVSSASPPTQELSNIRRLEEAGASAIVLSSLLEEQIRRESLEMDHHLSTMTGSFAEALTFFPQAGEFYLGPEEYLKHIQKAKAAVDVPIIASLNGASLGGWTRYAPQIEQAGADALVWNATFLHLRGYGRFWSGGGAEVHRHSAGCEVVHFDSDSAQVEPVFFIFHPAPGPRLTLVRNGSHCGTRPSTAWSGPRRP